MEDELAMHGQWGRGREAEWKITGDWGMGTGTRERSKPFRPRRGATGTLGTKLIMPPRGRVFSFKVAAIMDQCLLVLQPHPASSF